MKIVVDEVCPYCDLEAEIIYDLSKKNGKAICPHCGKEILLCSICEMKDCSKNNCFSLHESI